MCIVSAHQGGRGTHYTYIHSFRRRRLPVDGLSAPIPSLGTGHVYVCVYVCVFNYVCVYVRVCVCVCVVVVSVASFLLCVSEYIIPPSSVF